MKFRVVVATLALWCATLAVAQSTPAPAASQDSQQSSQQPAAQTPQQPAQTAQQPGQTPTTQQPDAQASQTQQPAAEPQDNQNPPQPPGAEPKKANSDNDADKDKQLKDIKPGSKDDVSAIGNRNIGKGKSLGDWYSLDSEIRMGKEYAQQIEASVKLNQDPVINEYVNRIGQNLVRNSDARVPFTIKVVEDDSINAFALPGGFFYVNTGLILAADEEAELAGVIERLLGK